MDNTTNVTDREYLQEMARILGMDMPKTAGLQGTPGEKKRRKAAALMPPKAMSKIAGMSMREIMEDENFRRGVFDEIASRRSSWEPALMGVFTGE